MTKNKEINLSKNKTFPVISADKLYDIHRDIRRYHHKWSQEQVIELADTSGIENFYTTTQYLTRTVPIVGAGLVAKGYTEAGVVTAGIALYANYLISSGKEKLFKFEEKKKKYTEISKDIENLYERYYDLMEILKPLRDTDSSPELNKLLKSLREELDEIIKKGEINGQESKWEERLSCIFWSLRKDSSSKVKELILLNNGIKVLESWSELPLTDKAKTEFSRLFISLRKSNQVWTEWEREWEARRSEHEKIKNLVGILQVAISEYRQEIANSEIEEGIKEGMFKLGLKEVEKDEELVVLSNNNHNAQLLEDKNIVPGSSSAGEFRRRSISNSKQNKPNQEVYELVELQSQEELQSIQEIPTK